MKIKKAAKKLAKARDLLFSVLNQYADRGSLARDLLLTARDNIRRAATFLTAGARQTATPKKPARRRLTEAGRRKLSRAAKKRWALAKQKGKRTLA